MFQQPSLSPALAFAAGLALVGALALAVAYRDGRELWGFLRGREIDVFDLTTGTTGPVVLRGRARKAERALEAPFTGRACLAVQYAVEERRETKNGSTWEEIHGGAGAVPFVLEDDTGSVLVEPDRFRLGLDRAAAIRVDGGERPPEQIREFVERSEAVDSEEKTLDLKVVELNVGDDRRYVEHRLEPGETVTVFGEAVPRSGRSIGAGQVNAAIGPGSNRVVLSETSPTWTVLRVYWHVLVAAAIGLLCWGAAVALLLG